MAAAPTARRRLAPAGFAVCDAEPAKPATAAIALRTISGLRRLLRCRELKYRGTLPPRRQNGRNTPDVLHHPKLDLLSGEFDQATVSRPRSAAADLKDSSEASAMDEVLAQIKLRIEVELAESASGISTREPASRARPPDPASIPAPGS